MGALPNEVLHAEPALVSVLLAGAYDEASAVDRSVIERLALRPYAQVRDALGRASATLAWKGTVVSFVRPDAAFRQVGPLLTPSLLQAFHGQAIAVLGEVHPRFDLPEGARERAVMHGLSLRHSDALRRGLAESVARFATRLGTAGGGPVEAPREFADRIVAELLHEAGWQKWASLSMFLPTLAEAAPDVFLRAVEDDLRAPQGGAVAVRRSLGSAVGPRSDHPHPQAAHG